MLTTKKNKKLLLAAASIMTAAVADAEAATTAKITSQWSPHSRQRLASRQGSGYCQNSKCLQCRRGDSTVRTSTQMAEPMRVALNPATNIENFGCVLGKSGGRESRGIMMGKKERL